MSAGNVVGGPEVPGNNDPANVRIEPISNDTREKNMGTNQYHLLNEDKLNKISGLVKPQKTI